MLLAYDRRLPLSQRFSEYGKLSYMLLELAILVRAT